MNVLPRFQVRDYQFDATPESEISKQFGETFVAQLTELKTGQWHGPIKSGYGARSLLKRYAVVIEQPQQEKEKKIVQMSGR